MKQRNGDFVFENVSNIDKVILTVAVPIRLIQSFIEFNSLYVFPTMRFVKNWWTVGLVYSGIKSSSEVKMKDGSSIVFDRRNINELVSKMRSIGLDERISKKLDVKIHGEKATIRAGKRTLNIGLESLSAVALEFFNKPHKQMNVKGRVVVDIGAYLGETAIYYATEGKAKAVYAYEIFPFLCRKASTNIKINGLENKIKVFNEGLGGKPGSQMISSGESSFAKLDAVHHKDKVRVKIVTLDQIVDTYRIKNGALKVDCEGQEYNIFKTASSKALHAFDIMHIEYHYGYKDLVERLTKEGFDVEYTKPSMNIKGFSKPMLNGDILATIKN